MIEELSDKYNKKLLIIEPFNIEDLYILFITITIFFNIIKI